MKRKTGPSRPASRGQRPSSESLPCRSAFDLARIQRQLFPLPSGRYKLKEALDSLRASEKTVKAIERIVTVGDSPPPNHVIGNCVASERATWLKSLPKQIARTFGYQVIPAIEALRGDYLPGRQAQDIAVKLNGRVDFLVTRCDLQRRSIYPSIQTEYAAMRSGRSRLGGLLADAIELVEELLETVDSGRLRVVLSRPPGTNHQRDC